MENFTITCKYCVPSIRWQKKTLFSRFYLSLPNSRRVLGLTDGIENLGGMQWNLFVCLVVGWILIYLVIRKGLHQSGKVSLQGDP